MATLQKTIIGATLAVAVGTGIYDARQASTLRKQFQTLKQQQAPLTEQVQQMQQERDAVTQQLASLREENLRLKRNTVELLRLRHEVAQMRRQGETEQQFMSQQSAQLETTTLQARDFHVRYLPREELTNAGYATPAAALQTFWWAQTTGSYDDVKVCLSPAMRERANPNERQVFAKEQGMMAHILKGIQILAQKELSQDEVELKTQLEWNKVSLPAHPKGWPELGIFQLVKVGDEWKIGSPREYNREWELDKH